ncbi:TorD/DmsD family molecular chaperone [Halostella litorea]|uniref:TorD/DmsD family molecular chaperone n=1 Tax=Halostella litorea TaxID=2528831 RepID=UPI0010927B27|nr:molecular chaperone TorD family protein [Halostella litorea]
MTEGTTATARDARELPPAERLAALAVCWQEPTAELVEAVDAGAFGESADGVDEQSLRVEYTRLFLGPGPAQCPPYESVYRDAEEDEADALGPVYGPSTQAVARWYDEYDLRTREEWSAPPDHIATELEFAATLAETEPDHRLDQFLDEHLRQWVDEFAARVRANDPSPFYERLLDRTERTLYGAAGSDGDTA